MTNAEIDSLDWKKMDGLLPVVVQDSETLQVLMVAYANREALEETIRSRRVTFFSRSKQRLWTKGETSGHHLHLVRITADCDGDSLLVMAKPEGPSCHRETISCFGEESAPGIGFLGRLARVIDERYRARPEGLYTTKLFAEGVDRMAQKVGEEGVEVVIAAKNEDPQALLGEVADSVFHVMVLLRAKSLSLADAVELLRGRHR